MSAGRLLQRLLPCVLSLALGAACTAEGEGRAPVAAPQMTTTSDDPAAENYVGPALPRARVVLEDAFGGSHLVEVEVAANDPARQRGLMWRTELPEGKGMLFIFPQSRVNSFWMRNTLIPLDMAFIGEDGVIVGVVTQAVPKSLASRGVSTPSKYVLEVPGGWFEKIGVRPGSKVTFQGTSMIPIE
ncbi:MAG: DUF192 domain-containing protein [Myxococcaceae bacterium]